MAKKATEKKIKAIEAKISTSTEATELIRLLAKKYNTKVHHAFPKQWAENMDVRLQLKSAVNNEVYNDNKKPRSSKVTLAIDILGHVINRKVFNLFGEKPPKYPSMFKRIWIRADANNQAIWDDHKEVVEAWLDIIKQTRPGYKFAGNILYVLEDPIKVRVRIPGQKTNSDISLEDLLPTMTIIAIVKEGMALRLASEGYPKDAPLNFNNCWFKGDHAVQAFYDDHKKDFEEAIRFIRKMFPDFWQGETLYVAKFSEGCSE